LFLNESSGWFHSWVAVLPSGFGFASVVTATLSESLGKTATHEWNQPLDSFKNKNEIRLITGKAEVMTMSPLPSVSPSERLVKSCGSPN
jgi:hypothetical protein